MKLPKNGIKNTFFKNTFIVNLYQASFFLLKLKTFAANKKIIVMNIKFHTSIKKCFENTKRLTREYGNLSKHILRTIERFIIADVHNHLQLPGNPHVLKYCCPDVYSITIRHPHRLLYQVDVESNSVIILGVMDYHNHQRAYSRIL